MNLQSLGDPWTENLSGLDRLENAFVYPLRVFNKTCYEVFQFGHIIMFLLFLLLCLNYLIVSKQKEYEDKLHAMNFQFLKKRGRVGSIVCLAIGFGFLIKILPKIILFCFKPFPAPILFNWLNINELYKSNTSLSEIYSQDVYVTALLLAICLTSLTSTMMVLSGFYLTTINKRIFDSKLKAFKLMFLGLLLGFIVGFAPGFWLLV